MGLVGLEGLEWVGDGRSSKKALRGDLEGEGAGDEAWYLS